MSNYSLAESKSIKKEDTYSYDALKACIARVSSRSWYHLG